MSDLKQRIIDFLIKHADPSIVLRVKKELLGSVSEAEQKDLINKIIPQKNVQTVINSQKPDGWFGNNFHGQSPKLNAGMFDNMEVGLRYLTEKGFPLENEYIARAINSFLTKEPFDSAYGGKPPEPPTTDYTYTASGLYLARSSIIIRAGYENKLLANDFIDLQSDIEFSLKTFQSVLDLDFPNGVLDTHRKKLCFKPNVLWPCLYHLRMLAHSQNWKTDESISMLAESITKLHALPQSDEMVYTYKKGQYVGPCFAFVYAQGKTLGANDEKDISLDLLELFARCGIIKKAKKLKAKYDYMLSAIDADLNVNIDVNKHQSRNWSPYFGYALEEDWKTSTKMKCDLLFRILLIIHYTECVHN